MQTNILSIAMLSLVLACSSPVAKPHIGSKKGATSSATPSESTGDAMASSATINKQSLKEVADEVVASTSDRCVGGVDKTPASKADRSTLRLLTRDEYNRTIQDVLGLSKSFTESLAPEHKILGFSNNSTINLVGETEMSSYVNTARAVAKEALSGSSSLPCKDGASCAENILNNTAALAWRRPLEADEKTRLLALYQAASADGVNIGLEVMLTGLLSSPNFLYRSEVGKSGKLSPYEAASALSYFFWAAPPDADLRKLAADGTILDAKVLAAQAQRLMSSDRAKAGVSAFSEAYLIYSNVIGLNKNATKFKEFTTEVKTSLSNEARDTFDYWTRSKAAKFADLFTAQSTVGDDTLANFYGATASQSGSTKLLDFSNSPRQGVLGFAGVLSLLATADESHPIRRGLYIREQMLCETMEPTPQGLVVAVPPFKEGMTTRERFGPTQPAPRVARVIISSMAWALVWKTSME